MAVISVYRLLKTTELLPVGVLEIDMDAAAERITVIDRDLLETVYANVFTSPLKVVVPIEYATKNGLLVMILDDNAQYNAAVLDGVRASVINLSEI